MMIDWKPISLLPDTLKDGRKVLLWDDGPIIGVWTEARWHWHDEDGWSDAIEGGPINDPTAFAEVQPPTQDSEVIMEPIETREPGAHPKLLRTVQGLPLPEIASALGIVTLVSDPFDANNWTIETSTGTVIERVPSVVAEWICGRC